jgi:hypothetical protein
MLNKFREALEQLLYDYGQAGIKLESLSYDLTDIYYFDKEKDESGSYKDIENLKFKIEVTNE